MPNISAPGRDRTLWRHFDREAVRRRPALDSIHAGLITTTGKKRLIRRPCPACSSPLLGSPDGAETCWCALPCPQCQAQVGHRCTRPSEHNVFGNRPHESRARLAQADTERRAQAGDPDIPARWRPVPEDQPALR
jgi:hypothetical protein